MHGNLAVEALKFNACSPHHTVTDKHMRRWASNNSKKELAVLDADFDVHCLGTPEVDKPCLCHHAHMHLQKRTTRAHLP